MAAVHTNKYRQPDSARFQHLNEFEQKLVYQVPHLLESYHYINKQSFVDAIRNAGDKVFLDSGAFSAYSLGVKIDLPTYCDYIIRNQDIIRVEDGVMMASVLDGIGDPLLTWQNQQRMEKLGAKPLPCFHAGEDERYLEHYVKNYEYITLGGMVGGSTKQLMIWLDRIWENYLTDGSGRPRLKVHGFGITAIPLMERYPWYSCDSSSWIQSAAFGAVVTPDYGPIQVSDKSPSRHIRNQHLFSYDEPIRKRMYDMFESQGFDGDRLSTVYESRAVYNLWAYGEINKQIDAVNDGTNFTGAIQELF